MSEPTIFETRRPQIFPLLEASEIERVRHFGVVRSYATGEAMATVGTVGAGLTIILSGEADVFQRGVSGRHDLIVTHRPGSFMGELAQLAGRPALVDVVAREPVEALLIAPDKLRALLIAE